MALKAGYYGIKDYLVSKLKRLPPIKSIGSGLQLTSAGVLKATVSPTDVGVVEVRTHTYEGNGNTTVCNITQIEVEEGATPLFVLSIEDITEDASYYNHINTFYPTSTWQRSGYTGTKGLKGQPYYDTYSGRAIKTEPSSGTFSISLSSGSNAAELCNEENHIYLVSYVVYKIATPNTTAKKAKK